MSYCPLKCLFKYSVQNVNHYEEEMWGGGQAACLVADVANDRQHVFLAFLSVSFGL